MERGASTLFSENQRCEEPSLTPLMRQYNEIKSRNPDTLLLYRMGDFYELFNEDAKIAAKVLGITLTSRNHGGAENTPLAGFPYHALDRYAGRLIKAGYKIAICEQIEDPKFAKGIVKRDIVEIISAGTATEDNFLEEKANNYIVSIHKENNIIGIAVCDLSTGFFQIDEFNEERVSTELVRIDPSEVLIAEEEKETFEKLIQNLSRTVVISYYDRWKFSYENASKAVKDHFEVISVEGFGFDRMKSAICAAGALLLYLKEQKKNELRHITKITIAKKSEYAELDPSTVRNLELLKPLFSDDKDGTLISILDMTATPMGSRLLKQWLLRPLLNKRDIEKRHDCVELLKKESFIRNEIELLLRSISDIERLIGKITYERANARDVVALKKSLAVFPKIIKVLSSVKNDMLSKLCTELNGFEEIVKEIDKTIVEEPPLSIREGGIIKEGVSSELDEIKNAAYNGKKWIAELQEKERNRTGIPSLKVGFNKVFGYYIEVSNTHINSVPSTYIRKQTLVNGERFITPELKEMESKILGAEERLASLEYEIFVELRKKIAKDCLRIQRAAEVIATIDVFVSLSKIASQYNYCRPEISEGREIIIKDGRHPVVERMNKSEAFIPNDLEIDPEDSQVLLITGPNMAGKSTYLRQNALIAIMAQMGSFVPASYAKIGIVDKFFTRIGASDRLAQGQSTFLVEMIEVANILNNATDRSLILLDEVGRGTSTFDGISIAWAVAEYLHETQGKRGRTLFATHYHELAEMELLYPKIKNFHIKVKEWNDKIIFLRKIEQGSCDHSYGIQVARLAGVPKEVIIRAREILANLENMELTPDHKPILAQHSLQKNKEEQADLFSGVQLNFFDSLKAEIIQQIKTIDLNSLTPLQALNILSELQQKAMNL